MIKRIIGLMLIFTILLGICHMGFAEEINNEPSLADTLEYEFLNTQNVLPKDMKETGKITRGEFMYIVSRLYFNGVTYSENISEYAFSDVSSDHPFINEIIILKNANILKGDSDNRLRCDDPITLNEALAVTLRVTGYEQYAAASGGYPTGYIYVAKTEGVLNGLNVSDSTINVYEALKIIYNSLFMRVVSLDRIENGEIKLTKGNERILTSHLKITLYDAVLTDNGLTSLDGNSIGSGKIKFKEISTGKYFAAKNNFKDVFSYLGVRLNIFVKYNSLTEENEVIYLNINSNVSEKTLTKTEIIRVTSDCVEYETDKNSGKSYKQYFSNDNPYVIINGINTPGYSLSQLKPENGFVTFIDNDSDNKADVISVMDFSHSILTDRVAEKVLYCKINAINTIDLSEENQKIYYRIIKNGTVIMPEDIQINDVVSVAVAAENIDGRKLHILYVSSDYVTGEVQGHEDNCVIINDKQYEMTNAFFNANPLFKNGSAAGTSGIFRLNVSGKIEFLDKGVSTEIGYSYLINIAEKPPFDEVILKYYSVKGEIVTGIISKNVKIDGVSLDGKLINNASASNYNEVRELLCVRPDGSVDIPTSEAYSFYNKKFTNINPRPAIIKLNSKNEIISIDTDAPTYTSGVLNTDYSQALVPGVRHPMDDLFYGTTFDGGFLINQDTICIKVPDIDRYGLLDGEYSITYMNTFELDIDDINNYGIYTATSYLNSTTNYDMQAYNVDPNTGLAGLVVVRGSSKRVLTTAGGMGVFIKLTPCYDTIREKEAYKLYYYINGEVKTTIVDTDYLHIWYQNLLFGGKYANSILNPGTMSELAFYEDVEPLKKGDIIGVETTGSYLSVIGRDLNLSKIYDKIPSTGRPSAPSESYEYNSYNINGTTIPFDENNLKKKGYEDSANFELSVALGITGTTLKTRVMYDNTTKVSTIRDYLENDGNIDYFDRFLSVAATVPITVIKETSCNVSSDSCEFIAEAGSLNDIKPALSGSATDINKASKLYIYHSRGAVKEIVVINLLEAHSNH